MELTQLFDDNDAVSPVIGVILMVAITVILAAVIGTFVLGLGDQVSNTSPSASFSFDYDDSGTDDNSGGLAQSAETDGSLTITHDGGTSIKNAQLSFTDGTATVEDPYSTTDVSAGSSASVQADADDTVRVIWQSSNGGDTATLGKWTGPQA